MGSHYSGYNSLTVIQFRLRFEVNQFQSIVSSLGHVYTATGDYANALASHKQCVDLIRTQLDDKLMVSDHDAIFEKLVPIVNLNEIDQTIRT